MQAAAGRTSIQTILAGALLCMLAACMGTAKVTAPALAPGAALDDALGAVVRDPVVGMASLSVLAIRNGNISYEGQFGHRRIDGADPSNSIAVTPQTMYRIASVSKLVTTLGVMKLVEEGKLALDRDVSEYLGFNLRNPAFPERAISLRMLLSHTSSLRDDGGYSWGPGTTLRSSMQGNGKMWAAGTAPGTYFMYSNLNWGVVGTVMEAASGERFDRLMQRTVLTPLGLQGGFNVAAFAPGELANVATLYRKPALQWVAQVDDFSARAPLEPAGLDTYVIGSNGTVFSPTGGLRISAAGLGKIMLMLMDEGRVDGKPFLRADSVALMFSRQWQYDAAANNGDTHHGLFTRWGLGTQHFDHVAGRGNGLVDGGGFSAAGHLGEAYGLLSVFVIDFARRNGMIVLIGGTARDPSGTPGRYSALSRQEELVLTPLYRQAVLTAP